MTFCAYPLTTSVFPGWGGAPILGPPCIPPTGALAIVTDPGVTRPPTVDDMLGVTMGEGTVAMVEWLVAKDVGGLVVFAVDWLDEAVEVENVNEATATIKSITNMYESVMKYKSMFFEFEYN